MESFQNQYEIRTHLCVRIDFLYKADISTVWIEIHYSREEVFILESCQIISDIENLSAQISYVRSLAQDSKYQKKPLRDGLDASSIPNAGPTVMDNCKSIWNFTNCLS